MSRLNACLCPPQKEPLKTLVFESCYHGCSVTCNATGYKTPNFVFDDSPLYGIARAILFRRSVAEHACQRCLTTLCGHAPACTVPRQHRVISYHPMMDVTTHRCQAPPGTAFDHAPEEAGADGVPPDVVQHARYQGFSDRVPSSIRSGGLWRHTVVEHGLGGDLTTGNSRACFFVADDDSDV
jgi:hypothetical protein